MRHTCLLALSLSSLVACTGEPSGDGSEPEPEPVVNPATLVGTWSGYVENHQFDDGTDTIQITIDSEQGGLVTGVVSFGDRTPYPPATDPDATYPPGQPESFGGPLWGEPLTGFAFTIRDGQYDGSRLRFSVSQYDLWAGWCSLQTPIFDDYNGDGYSCVPNWAHGGGDNGCFVVNPTTEVEEPVACTKLDLCQYRICGCDAVSCAVTVAPTHTFDIAVDLEDAEADGSFVGDELRIVRLTRD
jgi:hypothetical protein